MPLFVVGDVRGFHLAMGVRIVVVVSAFGPEMFFLGVVGDAVRVAALGSGGRGGTG